MLYQETANSVLNCLLTRPEGEHGSFSHFSLETWEWPQGVATYAMMQLYQLSADPLLLHQVQKIYDDHIHKGLPEKNINTTAPMLGLLLLYQKTGHDQYLCIIHEWAEWIMTQLPRTEEDGFQHVTSRLLNEQQLWDDTLYMAVLFLYKAGLVLNRPSYCDEAKYQFLLHIKYLHDVNSGLWYHGYTFSDRKHYNKALWARGNSWFTACAVDLLEGTNQKSDPAIRMILETWREQCKALIELQDPVSGLWHTLLNDQSSYLETSASAAIAYGLLKGIRLGLLESSVLNHAQKAVDGVIHMIGDDGLVKGVSGGTPLGNDEAFYKRIPIIPTAYGQGLTYLMLTEALRLHH